MERGDTREFTRDRSETEQTAPLLVRCFWCERLHAGEHPLSVCPVCTARFAMMRLLEMSGSFPLNDAAIDDTLMRTSPGNYALGYMDGESFTVFYIGRSDCDLRKRLHAWVGMPSRHESYASAAKAPWGVRHRGPLPMGTPVFAPVANVETSYTHFAFSYARSADEAYAKEWRNYEAFDGGRGLDNEAEPISVARSTNGLRSNAATAPAA